MVGVVGVVGVVGCWPPASEGSQCRTLVGYLCSWGGCVMRSRLGGLVGWWAGCACVSVRRVYLISQGALWL